MADLEKQEPVTEEEPDSFEKFAEEFQGAKYQRSPEEPEEEPEKEPEEEPEEPEPEVTEEPEEPEVTQPDDEVDPQVKLYTVPDQDMYGELRGQKVTVQQLEDAGLIGKVITRDHQEMHNTKLYQRLKEEFDTKLEERMAGLNREAPATPPAPAPRDPKAFGDEIERTYVPALEKLAEAGSFEPDFVQAYPRFASHTAHQLETMRVVGAGLVEAVNEVKQWVGMQQATTTRDAGMQKLHSSMTELAQDELYAGLREESERTGFVDWMSAKDNPQPWKKLDIEKELSNPDTLKGAYAAYRTATGGARTEATPPPADDTRQKAKMAAGGGGTTRTAKSKPVLNEFEQMKQELETSRARAFGR